MAKCDVQTLINNAKCFECLSPGIWEIIELQLLCEILAVGQESLTPTNVFVSQQIAIANEDFTATIPHGLGRVPVFLRVVAVFQNDDVNTGAIKGQEVDLDNFDWPADDAQHSFAHSRWTYFCDAINVTVAHACWACDPLLGPNLMVEGGGDRLSIDSPSNVKLKIYAF